MAFKGPSPIKWTFIASADLSALQYTFVKLTTTGQIAACTALTDVPLGVLLDKPTSGQTAEVILAGIIKVKCGAALTPSTTVAIGTDTTGRAIGLTLADTATKFSVGFPIQVSTAANQLVTCVIDCTNPNRAA